MSVGLIRNIGGAGGGTKGRFICSTDNLQVDDVIRVRSLTDPTKIYEATVETIGETIMFNVPGMDYYKVCLVQVIDETPTEIGGIKTILDIGEGYYVNVLNKTTLGGIQGILNAHQETILLSIGDEVTVKVNNADWIFQVAAINLYADHEVIFASKYLWKSGVWNSTESDGRNYTDSTMRTEIQSFYNLISAEDSQYIALRDDIEAECSRSGSDWNTFSDYIFIPSKKEALGIYHTADTPPSPQYQWPLFETAVNRIRIKSATTEAAHWWLSTNRGTNCSTITADGEESYLGMASNRWYLPCFALRANS